MRLSGRAHRVAGEGAATHALRLDDVLGMAVAELATLASTPSEERPVGRHRCGAVMPARRVAQLAWSVARTRVVAP